MNPSKLAFAAPTFDSFKNFGFANPRTTVSGVIAPGVLASYATQTILDRTNATTQLYFTTSVSSDFHSTGITYLLLPGTFISHDNGSTASFPGTAAYGIFFETSVDKNAITITPIVFNPYSEDLTVVTEALSFLLYSFVGPFDA